METAQEAAEEVREALEEYAREHPLLAAVVAVASVYEAFAILTGKVPTISALIQRQHPLTRAVIWLLLALAGLDHFVLRRWL